MQPGQEPPIDGFINRNAERRALVTNATYVLVQSCMADEGFAFDIPVDDGGGGPDNFYRPFGLETEADLRPAPSQPPSKPAKVVSDAYLLALYGPPDRLTTVAGDDGVKIGIPAEGCEAEAETTLLPENRIREQELRTLLIRLRSESATRLAEVAGYRELNAQWAECMAKAGYQLSEPHDVFNSDSPDDPQKRAADVQCKKELDYISIAFGYLAQVQDDLLQDHPGIMEEATRIFEDQYRIAADVLKDS
jgi:hypothetical protein